MSNPITNIYNFVRTQSEKLNLAVHGALAFVAFGLMRFANIILDASYAESLFPVPYYVGQTAFSGEQIKEYYAFMIDAGTLNVYWQTQFIDYAFIGMVIITGLLLPSFVARLHAKGSWLAAITFGFALLMPLGGLFDAIENLISFVMLSQPETFANWLAIPYSTFAVLKFGAIAPAQVGTVLSLIVALVLIAWRRFSQRSTVAVA